LFGGSGLSSATEDSLRKNFLISDRLDVLAEALRTPYASAFEPPAHHHLTIPENPIHKTNERLAGLLDHMDALRPLAVESANLIRSMNDASIRMLGDFGYNARRNEIYNRTIILIAALSLVTTAVFSIMSYSGQDQVDVQTEKLISALGRFTQAQSETQEKQAEALTATFQKLLATKSEQDHADFIDALQKVLTRAGPEEGVAATP
jgi:hypothetical protein